MTVRHGSMGPEKLFDDILEYSSSGHEKYFTIYNVS